MISFSSIRKIIYPLFFSITALAQQPDRVAPVNLIGNLPMPDSSFMFSSVFIVNEKPSILKTFRPSIFSNLQLNAIASSQLGKGRILLFGSSAYFCNHLLNTPEMAKTIDNLLEWGKTVAKTKSLIGFYGKRTEDLKTFIENRADCYVIDGHEVRKNTSIVFLSQDITDAALLRNIEQYVKSGGTLIFGSPYSEAKWDTKNKAAVTSELKINSLFLKAGLSNNTNRLFNGRETAKRLSDSIPGYLHPVSLLHWLKKNDLKKMDYYIQPFAVDPTIKLMFEHNGINSPILRSIRKDFKYADSVLLPSKEHPVKINNTEAYWGYVFNHLLAEKGYLNAPTVTAINYKTFPGVVPVESFRTNNEVVILPVKVGSQDLPEPQPIYSRPHSTGFYIPAGERVSIHIDNADLNMSIKIGVHSDDLTHLDAVNRDGFDLTKTFKLVKINTEIYSPYGGLLLICIPDTSTLKEIKFSITGAIKAPRFELNKTTEEQWRAEIRNYPAPWAELATDNIILTIPSYRIRKLENPEKLMKFWDKVMNANADLAAISSHRTHPERIIVDSEVAYGYMFTTKEKIVVPDDQSCALMLDADSLMKKGAWGLFHEIGHRHQFSDLDFSGLTEVSVNLFTLYVYNQVLNKGLFENEKFPNRQTLLDRVDKYLGDLPSLKKWKQDPFLALSMYVQIIDAFGWESVQEVYSQYRKLPKESYPKSNEDKTDLWFTSICEATKSDLTDFFEIWKIPVSDAAKQRVKKYKNWLPLDMVKYRK